MISHAPQVRRQLQWGQLIAKSALGPTSTTPRGVDPYRAIFEALPTPAVVLRGRCVQFANTAFKHFVDTRLFSRCIRTRLDRWLSPEDRDLLTPWLTRMHECGRVAPLRVSMAVNGGEQLVVQLSATRLPEFDDSTCLVLLEPACKNVDSALQSQLVLLEGAYRDAPDATVLTNLDREIVMCNPALTRTFGYAASEVLGQRTVILYASPDEYARQGRLRFNRSAEEKLAPYLVHYRRKNGELFWGETVGTAIQDLRGRNVGYLGVMRDVSDRVHAETLLRYEKARSDRYLEVSQAMIVGLNVDGQVELVNRRALEVLKYTREQLLGLDWFEHILPAPSRASMREFFDAAIAGKSSFPMKYENTCLTRDGEAVYIRWHNTVEYDADGQVCRTLSSGQDITERRRAEERLEYIASHDTLTGLPMRNVFFDRLEHAVAAAARKQQSLGVVFVDLDGFKGINDRHGHQVGDDFLVCVAERLRATLRAGDLIARFGGDEFLILLEAPIEQATAVERLRGILAELRAPIEIHQQQLAARASLGLALFPDDAESAEGLIRRADQSMYRAKRAGGQRMAYLATNEDC